MSITNISIVILDLMYLGVLIIPFLPYKECTEWIKYYNAHDHLLPLYTSIILSNMFTIMGVCIKLFYDLLCIYDYEGEERTEYYASESRSVHHLCCGILHTSLSINTLLTILFMISKITHIINISVYTSMLSHVVPLFINILCVYNLPPKRNIYYRTVFYIMGLCIISVYLSNIMIFNINTLKVIASTIIMTTIVDLINYVTYQFYQKHIKNETIIHQEYVLYK